MKTLLAGLAAAACVAAPACAKPKDADEAAILAVIQGFFHGLGSQNGTAMETALLPDAMLTAQRVGPDGEVKLSRRPGGVFIDSVEGQSGLDEKMWDPVVMRRGPIAVVWAPYEFQLQGKTTHCGIDVFDMVKVEGTWKIAHLMWTQEPDACGELKGKRR
ncbi:nuclear transport factor 2 family protein [Phenylobacterium sp. VNQ135]|uniref:nuclear transport factor 2 family protein n=1 Tax=Phenylobacterium sp. VNQ135 TaxID=3400922 RepID=UPI003BFEB8ED